MQDAHLLKLLITVLKGDFAIVTAGEIAKRFPTKNYVRDGLCAVPLGSKKLASAVPLDPPRASPDVLRCSRRICSTIVCRIRRGARPARHSFHCHLLRPKSRSPQS